MINKANIDKTTAWPFVEAKKILKDRKKYIDKKGKIILQTGYGPSGLPHIGTFGEVARTSMVVNALNYLTDVPNKDSSGNLDGSMLGTLSVVSKNNKGQQIILIKEAGLVDYKKGEIILNTINITSTSSQNNIIEVQAYPESNDVIGLKDLYLNFDVSNTTINMVKDVIASGEDVSGVVFQRDYYTSSYSNGDLERK